MVSTLSPMIMSVIGIIGEKPKTATRRAFSFNDKGIDSIISV